MTQEDKFLLLQDLSARLPYGVKIHHGIPTLLISIKSDRDGMKIITEGSYGEHIFDIEDMKPYLRQLSSMTEEECVELSKIRPFDDEVEAWKYIKTPVPLKIANIKHFDFFHSHHLDWRGLIENGLALEAPEGMYYNLKNK